MLGERIRYYRKRKNLTLQELAKGICSVSYLSKFENGGTASDEIVKLLCERLGIPFETDNAEEIKEAEELLDHWYGEIKKKNIDKAKEIYEEIQEKMQNIQVPEVLIRYDLFKARYLFSLEKIEEAKELLDKTKELEDFLSAELKYYYNLFTGVYYFYRRNTDKGLPFLKKAEAITHEIRLKDSALAEFYYEFGLIYTDKYLTSLSTNYVQKALSIFDQEYNLPRSADCQILLGINNRRMQNYEQAEYHYENAWKLMSSIHDPKTEMVLYHNLGYVYACQGKSEEAIKLYKKSLKIDDQNIRSLFLIADEYGKLKNIDVANEWIQKGLELSKQLQDEAYLYHFQILSHKLNEDFTEQYENLLRYRAIPYFRKSRQWDHVAEYTKLLGDYYFENQLYKKASIRYRQSFQADKKFN